MTLFKRNIAKLQESYVQLKTVANKNPQAFGKDGEKSQYLHNQMKKKMMTLLEEFERKLKSIESEKKFFELDYA